MIEITSKRRNNIVELSFKDNGLGIDLEKKSDQVFWTIQKISLSYRRKRNWSLYGEDADRDIGRANKYKKCSK